MGEVLGNSFPPPYDRTPRTRWSPATADASRPPASWFPRTSPTPGPASLPATLLAQIPLRAGGRVAYLDVRGGQAVADAVGQLPGLGRAQLLAQHDEALDERGHLLARVADAGRRRLAESMNQRVQDRARPLGLVRLQAVGRPLLDRAVEVQDRLGGLAGLTRAQRAPERLLERDSPRQQRRALGRRRRRTRRRRVCAAVGVAAVRRRAAGARRLAPGEGLQRVEIELLAGGEAARGAPAPHGERAATGDRDRAGVEVHDDRGVLVDAEHPGVVGQHRFHHRQPPLAHVAEARVVRAALGVVVVRDDDARALEAGRGSSDRGRPASAGWPAL